MSAAALLTGDEAGIYPGGHLWPRGRKRAIRVLRDAIKTDEVMTRATTRTHLENTMPNERGQSQKATERVIPFTRHAENRQSHRHRGCQGLGGEAGEELPTGVWVLWG